MPNYIQQKAFSICPLCSLMVMERPFIAISMEKISPADWHLTAIQWQLPTQIQLASEAKISKNCEEKCANEACVDSIKSRGQRENRIDLNARERKLEE